MRQLVTLERLENAEKLDRVASKVRPVITGALRNRAVKDALHGVWLGHPLHPMLTDVPVGTWTSAALLDLMPNSGKAPARLITVGLVAAAPTAAAGWADWSALHPQQARVGLVHASANVGAIGLYLLSLRARRRGHVASGRLLGWLGLASVGVGGAIGGHLSYRQASGANHTEHVPHVVPEGWRDVAALDDLPEGMPVERGLGGTKVMLVRHGDDVTAIADTCSHLSGPLHEGQLSTEGGEECVTCPWHGSVFRLRDGAVVHGPATSPQPTFRTRVTAGRVELQLA